MKKLALFMAGLLLISVLAAGCLFADDSNNFTDYLSEGKTLYLAQKYYQAMEVLQKAVELQPNNVTASYYLAMTLENLGLNRQAITEFKKIRSLSPNSEEGQAAKTELDKMQGKIVSLLLLKMGGALKDDEAIQFLQLLRDKIRAATPYEVYYLPEKESSQLAVDCQIARDRNADLVLSGRIITVNLQKMADNTYQYVLKFSASLEDSQTQNSLDYWDETITATGTSKDAAKTAAFDQATACLLLRVRVAMGLKYGIDDDPPFMEIATGVPDLSAFCLKMPVDQAKKLPLIIVTPFVDHTGANVSLATLGTAYLRNLLFYSGKYAVVFEQDFSRYFPYPLTDKDTAAFGKVVSKIQGNYLLLPHLDWMDKTIGGFVLGSTAKISGRIHIQLMDPNTGKELNEWEYQKTEQVGTFLFRSTQALDSEVFYSDKKFMLEALIDNLMSPLSQFIEMNYKPSYTGSGSSTASGDNASADANAPISRNNDVDVTNPPQPVYGDVADDVLMKGTPDLKSSQQLFNKIKSLIQKDVAWDTELYYMALRLSRGKVKNFVNQNGVQFAVFFDTFFTEPMMETDIQNKYLPYLKGDYNIGSVAISSSYRGNNVVILLKKK